MPTTERLEIRPAARINGEAEMPGDKSISHRLAMIAGIAEGTSTIFNFAESADCASTLDCLKRLGVPAHRDGATVFIEGQGLSGLRKAPMDLDAGNSGSTVRMMSGIVAAQPFESTFVGDASLSGRPMARIIRPLRQFGAVIQARDDNYLPLRIKGGSLNAIEYQLPVASAQVKSAVLLAGVFARGRTRVLETHATRNHTEIALREFGARLETMEGAVSIEGGVPLRGRTFAVPGDLSSAAFMIAAALGIPGSTLRLKGVGVNPTRAGFLRLVEEMGGRITIDEDVNATGEPVGDIVVEGSELEGLEIRGSWIPNIIDEIPILAVLGTRTKAGIRISQASELRTKESDRIKSVVTNLRRLGAEVEEFPDGMFVPGNQPLHGGIVESYGDHRIAMAFAVAGLFASDTVVIEDPSCVGISFPGFFEVLRRLTA